MDDRRGWVVLGLGRAGWMMTRMLSSGPGVGGRDDLGARLLAEHPRGEEWRQLDVTVANLTLDQLVGMGGLVEPGDQRAAARAQLIEGIGEGELAGRLGSRWVRWADTFGLPQPSDVGRRIVEVLGHPYTLAEGDELSAAYLAGVLAVFDAGLGIAAAPAGDTGTGAYQLLTGPWRRMCLPSRFTPTWLSSHDAPDGRAPNPGRDPYQRGGLPAPWRRLSGRRIHGSGGRCLFESCMSRSRRGWPRSSGRGS